MVKEESFSADISAPLQEFCALFEDPKTFVNYHNAVNGNPHVKIANWENGTRRVAFLCPYDAPTWLKKAIGTDVVKIRDYQELHKKHEPETGELVSLSMVSSPRLFIPGRKDDLQIATTHFTATQTKLPDGSLGVKMAAYVRCSAEELKFLWAFQGAIENVMLYKCKHIATSFLEYCADHLQRAQLRRASASDSAASLRLPAEAPQAEDPRAREEEKCGSEAMLSGGAVRPIIATGAGAPPGGCSSDGVEVRLWLEEAEEAGAWYDATSGSDSDPPTPPPQLGSTDRARLRDIQKTIRHTLATMQALDERQGLMERQLRQLQRRLAPGSGIQGQVWGLQAWLAEADPFLLTAAIAATVGVSFAGGWFFAVRKRSRSWW